MKYAFMYEIMYAGRKTGPDKSHLIVRIIVNCSGCIKVWYKNKYTRYKNLQFLESKKLLIMQPCILTAIRWRQPDILTNF